LLKSAYKIPPADDPQWVAVDLKPIKPFATPVLLAAIRYDKRLRPAALDQTVATFCYAAH